MTELQDLTKKALVRMVEVLEASLKSALDNSAFAWRQHNALRVDLQQEQSKTHSLDIECKLAFALSENRRWEDVAADIVEQEREMWHNASLLHTSIDDDELGDKFETALELYVREWVGEKEREILEKFGRSVSVYQYGRGGATISIDGFYSETYRRGASDANIRYFDNDDLDEEELIAYYNEDVQTLAILEWLDEKVRETVRGLPEWWVGEREYWTDGLYTLYPQC